MKRNNNNSRPLVGQSSPTMMRIKSWWLLAIATITMLGNSAGGQDICACAPTTYEFTFDFGLTCPPINVTRDGGVAATYCQIFPFGDPNQNITDTVPVAVDYVDILELGQDFTVVVQENVTGGFLDGESFEYTSIIARDSGGDPEIPRVLQLNIFGVNALDQPIVNFFAIAYSNNCLTFPVLQEGNSAGWTRFTSLENPTQETCPAAPAGPAPTDAPVTPPTEPPVEPTDPPVDPTDPPVEPTDPPVEPTDPPVEPTDPPVEPTDPPVEPPTEPPVDPTDPPVEPPSDPPVDPPTDPPVVDPTDAPVAPVVTPTRPPAPAPVQPPVDMSMSMYMDDMSDMDYFMSMEFGGGSGGGMSMGHGGGAGGGMSMGYGDGAMSMGYGGGGGMSMGYGGDGMSMSMGYDIEELMASMEFGRQSAPRNGKKDTKKGAKKKNEASPMVEKGEKEGKKGKKNGRRRLRLAKPLKV